jgi:small-conductance mechanosensitive channel
MANSSSAPIDVGFEGISAQAALTILGSIAAALVIHWLVFALLSRIARRTSDQSDDIMVAAMRGPTRWLVALLALGGGLQPLTLGPRFAAIWSIGSKMVFALLAGWLALSMMRGLRQLVELRSDMSVDDNLRARRRHTRVRILYRIMQFVIGFVVVAMMLMAIPGVRTIGVTLMASAGLAGLAVGAAAQPALKNLIAGIQMAFSEPIRLDDVVIIEGEWGRIEDIRLTYVIVRIWDDRRMVVPVSWFLEKPFQNWTTQTSDLLGTVFFHVDPRADVERIRAAFIAATKANARWDGRVAILQVTEHRPEALELRGLLSARNAGIAFDLRCEVREAVLGFLRSDMPEALPRSRLLLAPDDISPAIEGRQPA